MEYIEHNGIAIQYPKSLNQMAREFATEANRIFLQPHVAVGVYKAGYSIVSKDGIVTEYELDDMVP